MRVRRSVLDALSSTLFWTKISDVIPGTCWSNLLTFVNIGKVILKKGQVLVSLNYHLLLYLLLFSLRVSAPSFITTTGIFQIPYLFPVCASGISLVSYFFFLILILLLLLCHLLLLYLPYPISEFNYYLFD